MLYLGEQMTYKYKAAVFHSTPVTLTHRIYQLFYEIVFTFHRKTRQKHKKRRNLGKINFVYLYNSYRNNFTVKCFCEYLY